MEILQVPVTKLNPADYNPRQISDEELAGLKQSLLLFGFVEPLVINNDYTVISGHQRLKAAIELDFKDVPCFQVNLDKKQEKKLNIVLNSHAISGKYDEEQLSELLEELKLDDDYLLLRLDELETDDLKDFKPTDFNEDDRLDQKKLHKCPDCGYEFTD